MITKQTANLIYKAHRAIETSRVALEEVRALRVAPDPMREIIIRVPTGPTLYRDLEISSDMAERIISAHIVSKRLDLAECQERARAELQEGELQPGDQAPQTES